jgi:RsiW-degrading membrane proteinase PrsW (M82 family)
MTQRARKFFGVFVILAILVVYAWAATLIYERWLTGAPNWVLLAYFVVAGMGWALPAGVVITWMLRPDKPKA